MNFFFFKSLKRLQNPLHAALSNGMKRLALWLIHNGVDFEQRDLANKTPVKIRITLITFYR